MMQELAKTKSPETDSSNLCSPSHCSCALCISLVKKSPSGKEFGRWRRRDTDDKFSHLGSDTSVRFCGLAPSLESNNNNNVREIPEEETRGIGNNNLINENHLNPNLNTMTSPERTRTSFTRKMPSSTSSFKKITQHLLNSHSLILLLFISLFFISIPTSSATEVSSSQTQFGLSSSTSSSNNANNNMSPSNNNNNNNFANGGNNANASGRNINSGIFTNNNFGSSPSSGFSSLPSSTGGGSGGGNGGASPFTISPINPSTDPPSNSKPTAYFIAGLASQIRKINSTAMMLLTRDKPFQLQFRTVCPFGNIVYDVSDLLFLSFISFDFFSLFTQ